MSTKTLVIHKEETIFIQDAL